MIETIDRILAENNVEGDLLLGFGDGYVEIDNIKGVDGLAVAVASDEAGRSGRPDPWKRDRSTSMSDACATSWATHHDRSKRSSGSDTGSSTEPFSTTDVAAGFSRPGAAA